MCCKKRKIGHELRTLDNMMSRNLMAAARERGVDELTAMHGWILGYLCRNEHKDIFQKDIEAEFKICRSTVKLSSGIGQHQFFQPRVIGNGLPFDVALFLHEL